MTDQLWSAWLSQPMEIYCKGDFKGIIFAKFRGNTERDEVVGWFRKTSTKIQDTDVWSKPDRPLNERILMSLVFGTKYLCCKSLWADPEQGLVTLWGTKVLKGSIVDKKLSIEYGEGWETYLHDKDHPEFKDMVKTLHGKLASGEKGGKGGGKEGKFKGKFTSK